MAQYIGMPDFLHSEACVLKVPRNMKVILLTIFSILRLSSRPNERAQPGNAATGTEGTGVQNIAVI